MERVSGMSSPIKDKSMEPDDLFTTETAGLSEATNPNLIRLQDGGQLDLRIEPVRKRIDDAELRMLGYNGSIPGPTLHVDQGSEITVEITNDGDVEATVHWHGLRLENRYDGVPHETQAPIPIGGKYACKVQFPDAGFYWFHPHVREDYGLEMGLYGTIVVEPAGEVRLEHHTPDQIYHLGTFTVEGAKAGAAATPFDVLRVDPELTAVRPSLDHDLRRPPDKTLAFFSRMPLLYGTGDVAAAMYA